MEATVRLKGARPNGIQRYAQLKNVIQVMYKERGLDVPPNLQGMVVYCACEIGERNDWDMIEVREALRKFEKIQQ